MSPAQYLLLILTITALACLIQGFGVRRSRQALLQMARQHEMNFSATDRFRLAQRVQSQLPVFGASRVRVSDLVFASDAAQHRYAFTIEYTVGAVFGHRRLRCVGGYEESVRRGGKSMQGVMRFSISDAPMLEAYQQILEQMKSSRAESP